MPPSSKLSLWVSLALLVVASSASLSDYAPSITACPDTPLVRTFTATKQILNPLEKNFISERECNVIPEGWKAWLGDGSDIGYKTSEFVDHFARVGIAFSGGGYRASLFGAGVIAAFDARNASAAAAGTGGLLQIASYFSGLSGGAWLTAGVYMNGFPMVQDMVLGSQPGWTLDQDLLLPGGETDPTAPENLEYFSAIDQSVDAKAAAGFNVTIGDGWARMLSYHFLSGTNDSNFFDDSSHGAGQLWSQIAEAAFFTKKQAPFPLVVFDTNGTVNLTTEATSLDLTVYEVSPYEFASFDPDVSAGADLTFIGTSLFEGVPINKSSCVQGFDEAGFVIATSSDIFLADLFEGGAEEIGLLQELLGAPVDDLSPGNAVVSKWPNPFHGLGSPAFEDSLSPELELVDGGTNGEVIPLNPLFVKARGIDTIIAVDGSADTDENWPDASSLFFTAERLSTLLVDSHQQFPEIPASTDDFISQGLNLRPTFFGCSSTDTPLVIYLPNSPPLTGVAPFTNAPTGQVQFQVNETQVILNQVYENTIGGFVPNSNQPDPNWGKCLQCAVVDRSRLNVRPTIERSAFCTKCFTQYCYNPAILTSSAELPNRQLDYAGPSTISA